MGRSWIDSCRVLSGEVTVLERHLKHTSFAVECGKEGGVFVKQAGLGSAETQESLRREAKFYRFLNAREDLKLGNAVPGLVGFDSSNHILGLSCIHGQSLLERISNGGKIELNHAREIAKILAHLHKIFVVDVSSKIDLEECVSPLWSFSLLDYLEKNSSSIPGVAPQLYGVLKSHPFLPESMSAAVKHWRRQSVIHADVKWENLFLNSNGKSSEETLYLLDWESVCLGDSAWDLASFIQAGLAVICSQKGVPNSLRQSDVREYQEVVRAFWQSWIEAAEVPEIQIEEELYRMVEFCAVRLVQSAYEQACVSTELRPSSISMVTTAWEMLRDHQYAREFLGLAR